MGGKEISEGGKAGVNTYCLIEREAPVLCIIGQYIANEMPYHLTKDGRSFSVGKIT